MKTNKPLLTISLLISNRPDTIPKCLESLKPIMEGIPSELILIDTSKSEEIHNLLLSYTDKVYEFEWCKDFAKARNEGVRRAKGEWFLYLDDDEWIVEAEGILEFFHTKKHKKYKYANIQIRNFLNVDYTIYSDAWVTRLFYIGDGAKFEGKIHEYMTPVYGEPVFLQTKVYHSGYVYDTEEKRQKHFERNIQLLLEEIEANPGNLRWIAQLVQEYCSIFDWEAMVSLCKKEITEAMEFHSYMDRNHFCTLYAGLVEGLTNLKQNKNALEICEIGLQDERSTELLKSLLHFYSAANYLQLKEWNKVKIHINQYFEDYEFFQENTERMNEQLGSLLVHRVFNSDYIENASSMLVYAELNKENIEIPFAEDSEETKTEMDVESVRKLVKEMVKLIATLGYREVFKNFLKNMVEDINFCKLACAEALQLEKADEAAFQKVAYVFSKMESDFWYICYCRIIEADARGDKADVENAIEELLREMSVVCYMPDRVYEIIDKYDIKIALLWDKVVGEQWTEHVKHLVNNSEDVYIDKAYDYLLDVYEESDWRVMDLVSALQEKLLLIQQREEMNMLREQVLEQVKALREAGKVQEAEQIMAQLRQMFPENEK